MQNNQGWACPRPGTVRVRYGPGTPPLAPALAKFLSGVSIMGFRYAVIGSGRQGTAAAYDLALLGDAEYVLIADMSLAQAERSAARVNSLVGREVARAAQVNVQD